MKTTHFLKFTFRTQTFRANNLIIGTLLFIGHRINQNVTLQVCLKSCHKFGPFLNENCLCGYFFLFFFYFILFFCRFLLI